MDLCTYIQNTWGKCQILGNKGMNFAKLHHKMRMLHHQDIIVASWYHYIMVFGVDASHMCLIYAKYVNCFIVHSDAP